MTVNAIAVGPGKLTIGGDAALNDFSDQCTGAKLTPDVKKDEPITVLSGKQAPGARTESNKLTVSLLNDFGVQDSRVEWMWEHRGQEMPFTYQPNSAQQRAIKGVVVVEAIELGGDVTKKPANEVSLDVLGEVEFVDVTG